MALVRDQKEQYKFESHHWVYFKGLAREICQNCGLVKLRNDLTEWCVRMGCNNKDHPQYKQQLRMKRDVE